MPSSSRRLVRSASSAPVYRSHVDEAPRISRLAAHAPVPVFTSGFAFDDMVGSALFVSDEPATSGFTSEQTEQCTSGRFIPGFKRYDRAAPRNAAYGGLAATYANARLLLQRLCQEIDVLENPSRSRRNSYVAVKVTCITIPLFAITKMGRMGRCRDSAVKARNLTISSRCRGTPSMSSSRWPIEIAMDTPSCRTSLNGQMGVFV